MEKLKKVMFKNVGYSLVTEMTTLDPVTMQNYAKKATLTHTGKGQYMVSFESGGNLISSIRAKDLTDAKELARKYIREER